MAECRATGEVAIEQVAALVYRWGAAGELQILMVTSLGGKRWLLPKGNLIAGLCQPEVAAQEAFEEAGALGSISSMPVGRYFARKRDVKGRRRSLRITVYPLHFGLQAQIWPEQGRRKVGWFSPERVAALVREPGLAKIIAKWRHGPMAAPSLETTTKSLTQSPTTFCP